MRDFDLAAQLANHPRSVRAIALALIEAAAGDLGESETENGRALVKALADHEVEIDAVTIPRVIIALAALFAAKTNSSPKQIWEQLWKDAPTDAWWRDRVNPTRGER